MMPIMDGYRVREAQGKDPELAQIPVVIMSADGHAMEKQTKINAAAFIKKPLDIDRLVQTLQTHWV
jgi:CheY-like chemotaxis protein